MSKRIISPFQTELEKRVETLEQQVAGLAQFVSLIDKYLVVNKHFFDQLKMNAPQQAQEPEKK